MVANLHRASNHQLVDVCIVGGGPAGLAAAAACQQKGISAIVLEQGGSLKSRDRHKPEEIGSGVGGAGLFSDGKFSFFPSATRLWRLRPKVELIEAYDWLVSLLEEHQLCAPPFPIEIEEGSPNKDAIRLCCFTSKHYPSFYVPLSTRYALIESLGRAAVTNLYTCCRVYAISWTSSQCIIRCRFKNGSNRDGLTISARALIFATGRLGPLFLETILSPADLVFRRLEVGVRIEQPARDFFLRENSALDPKLIIAPARRELQYRTFCCCRDGEVVAVRIDDLVSVSGRADIAPSGRSNVGFNVRITSEPLAIEVWNDLKDRLVREACPVREPLGDFLQNARGPSAGVRAILGERLGGHLAAGLRHLMSQIGEGAFTKSILHAPALEGVPRYPSVSDSLRIGGAPIWVVGDAAGLFRGLTAALVSGYFAGVDVAAYLRVLK